MDRQNTFQQPETIPSKSIFRLRPWLLQFVLGSEKPPPGKLLHLIRGVSGPCEDGGFIKDGSDGEVIIRARFSGPAITRVLSNIDTQSQEHVEWDRSLVILTDYRLEHRPSLNKNDCFFELVVNGFKTWGNYTGCRMKSSLKYCMEMPDVQRKSAQLWMNWRLAARSKSTSTLGSTEASQISASQVDDSLNSTQLTQLVQRINCPSDEDSDKKKSSDSNATDSENEMTAESSVRGPENDKSTEKNAEKRAKSNATDSRRETVERNTTGPDKGGNTTLVHGGIFTKKVSMHRLSLKDLPGCQRVSALDKSLQKFAIPRADYEILESIERWKADYRPPQESQESSLDPSATLSSAKDVSTREKSNNKSASPESIQPQPEQATTSGAVKTATKVVPVSERQQSGEISVTSGKTDDDSIGSTQGQRIPSTDSDTSSTHQVTLSGDGPGASGDSSRRNTPVKPKSKTKALTEKPGRKKSTSNSENPSSEVRKVPDALDISVPNLIKDVGECLEEVDLSVCDVTSFVDNTQSRVFTNGASKQADGSKESTDIHSPTTEAQKAPASMINRKIIMHQFSGGSSASVTPSSKSSLKDKRVQRDTCEKIQKSQPNSDSRSSLSKSSIAKHIRSVELSGDESPRRSPRRPKPSYKLKDILKDSAQSKKGSKISPLVPKTPRSQRKSPSEDGSTIDQALVPHTQYHSTQIDEASQAVPRPDVQLSPVLPSSQQTVSNQNDMSESCRFTVQAVVHSPSRPVSDIEKRRAEERVTNRPRFPTPLMDADEIVVLSRQSDEQKEKSSESNSDSNQNQNELAVTVRPKFSSHVTRSTRTMGKNAATSEEDACGPEVLESSLSPAQLRVNRMKSLQMYISSNSEPLGTNLSENSGGKTPESGQQSPVKRGRGRPRKVNRASTSPSANSSLHNSSDSDILGMASPEPSVGKTPRSRQKTPQSGARNNTAKKIEISSDSEPSSLSRRVTRSVSPAVSGQKALNLKGKAKNDTPSRRTVVPEDCLSPEILFDSPSPLTDSNEKVAPESDSHLPPTPEALSSKGKKMRKTKSAFTRETGKASPISSENAAKIGNIVPSTSLNQPVVIVAESVCATSSDQQLLAQEITYLESSGSNISSLVLVSDSNITSSGDTKSGEKVVNDKVKFSSPMTRSTGKFKTNTEDACELEDLDSSLSPSQLRVNKKKSQQLLYDSSESDRLVLTSPEPSGGKTPDSGQQSPVKRGRGRPRRVKSASNSPSLSASQIPLSSSEQSSHDELQEFEGASSKVVQESALSEIAQESAMSEVAQESAMSEFAQESTRSEVAQESAKSKFATEYRIYKNCKVVLADVALLFDFRKRTHHQEESNRENLDQQEDGTAVIKTEPSDDELPPSDIGLSTILSPKVCLERITVVEPKRVHSMQRKFEQLLNEDDIQPMVSESGEDVGSELDSEIDDAKSGCSHKSSKSRRSKRSRKVPVPIILDSSLEELPVFDVDQSYKQVTRSEARLEIKKKTFSIIPKRPKRSSSQDRLSESLTSEDSDWHHRMTLRTCAESSMNVQKKREHKRSPEVKNIRSSSRNKGRERKRYDLIEISTDEDTVPDKISHHQDSESDSGAREEKITSDDLEKEFEEDIVELPRSRSKKRKGRLSETVSDDEARSQTQSKLKGKLSKKAKSKTKVHNDEESKRVKSAKRKGERKTDSDSDLDMEDTDIIPEAMGKESKLGKGSKRKGERKIDSDNDIMEDPEFIPEAMGKKSKRVKSTKRKGERKIYTDSDIMEDPEFIPEAMGKKNKLVKSAKRKGARKTDSDSDIMEDPEFIPEAMGKKNKLVKSAKRKGERKIDSDSDLDMDDPEFISEAMGKKSKRAKGAKRKGARKTDSESDLDMEDPEFIPETGGKKSNKIKKAKKSRNESMMVLDVKEKKIGLVKEKTDGPDVNVLFTSSKKRARGQKRRLYTDKMAKLGEDLAEAPPDLDDSFRESDRKKRFLGEGMSHLFSPTSKTSQEKRMDHDEVRSPAHKLVSTYGSILKSRRKLIASPDNSLPPPQEETEGESSLNSEVDSSGKGEARGTDSLQDLEAVTPTEVANSSGDISTEVAKSTEVISTDAAKSAEVETSPDIFSTEAAKSTEVANSSGDISTEVAKSAEVISTEVPKSIEVISTEVAKSTEVISTEVAKSTEVISTEVPKSTEVISTEVAKSTEVISTEVPKSTEVISTEVAKSTEVISAEVAESTEVISAEVAESTGVMSTDVAKSTEVISTEVAKSNGAISTEVAKSTEVISTELARSVEIISTEAEKSKEVISTEVAKSIEIISTEVAKSTEVISTEVISPDEKVVQSDQNTTCKPSPSAQATETTDEGVVEEMGEAPSSQDLDLVLKSSGETPTTSGSSSNSLEPPTKKCQEEKQVEEGKQQEQTEQTVHSTESEQEKTSDRDQVDETQEEKEPQQERVEVIEQETLVNHGSEEVVDTGADLEEQDEGREIGEISSGDTPVNSLPSHQPQPQIIDNDADGKRLLTRVPVRDVNASPTGRGLIRWAQDFAAQVFTYFDNKKN